jgi:hypothetical protein
MTRATIPSFPVPNSLFPKNVGVFFGSVQGGG